MAVTLTHAMLEDLHRGCASIKLLAVPSGGSVDFKTLTFDSADEIFTLKDTFQISQDDPSTDEIKIDQNDETIDTDVTTGEMKLQGDIPSVASALLGYFFAAGQSAASVTASTGETYTGAGFFKTPKEVMASVLVVSASKKTAVVFARVKFVASLTQDSTSNPLCVRFAGTVLGNLKSGEGDFAVLKKSA